MSFINRIFRNKKISPSMQTVQGTDGNNKGPVQEPIPDETRETQFEAEYSTRPHLEVAQLIVGVAQSIGIQRDHNEDSLFTLTTNLLLDEESVSFGLYIIADGMGGHDNGEIASRLAVNGLASHVINALYIPLISTSSMDNISSIHEVMTTGILHAHQAIKKETEGGGTTITAALILGDQLTITHVGDSRAYYIDPIGNMKLLTRDHSLVKRLEEIGQISQEQALTDPRRNVLYRALGQGEPFDPDISSTQFYPGCQLLICSDGLWGVIPESDLTHILRSTMEPQFICQSLIQSANQAGGPDNISAILVRFPS